MKSFLPILSLLIVFTSCSTTYKSGQTPDDVYYSPAREVKEDKEQDKEEKYNKENNSSSYEDDRYIRMKVRNRDRWSEFDDYYRDPVAFTYQGCYCSCNYNPRLYWNNYYNAYSPKLIVYNPRSVIHTKPRGYNLSVFDSKGTVSTKQPVSQPKTYSTPSSRQTSSDNAGNVLRDVFRGSDRSNTSTSNPKAGSSSSSSSSSGSSSSSSGSATNNGNAPVRKF